MRPSLSGLLALALALLGSGPVSAQESVDSFYDAVEVHVVSFDVMVSDAEGEPISGLGPDDFEVLEDGEPVELTNFLAIEGRRVVGADETAGAVEPETRRLHLVVVLDALHLSPPHRAQLLERLDEWIVTSFSPEDRGMIVSVGPGVEVAAPFTHDPNVLRSSIADLRRVTGGGAALESQRQMLLTQMGQVRFPSSGRGPGAASPGPAGMALNQDLDAATAQISGFARQAESLSEQRRRQVETTLAAVATFTDTLAGMPGRKAIVYLSDGLPEHAGEALARAWLDRFESFAYENGTDLLDDVGRMMELSTTSRLDAADRLRDLIAHANAQDVVFYPLTAGARTGAGGIHAASATGAVESLRADTSEAMGRAASLMQVAAGTGGVAYQKAVALDDLLARVERDFDTYYSLGYVPRREPDAEHHEVEVRVRRPGAIVRHAASYREKDGTEVLVDRALSALYYGIEDNPLEMLVEAGEPVLVDGDRYRVPMRIEIPFERILLMPAGDRHSARLMAVVVARDASGGVSGVQRIELPVDVPNDRLLDLAGQMAAYPAELELRSGSTLVAVGLRDRLARESSIVRLEIEVGAGGSPPAAPGP